MASLPILPAALQPWAPQLDLFPLPTALALGPLVQRLAAALGPLRVAPESGNIEPDGFDGLARRGLPERLLVSEWLLLEEAPLEWLRRAAMGEQSFLRLARRDPHSARASFALFDGGASQLGAPRLAQLAALVVLARRAEAAGARFGWGIVQKPGVLRAQLAREDVEWWLEIARATREATPADFAAWNEFAAGNGGAPDDERWIIGGANLRAHGAKSDHFLWLEDALDPFAPAKTVLATLDHGAGGSAPRTFALELPDDRNATRLLREPFAEAAPKSPTKRKSGARIASNLVWANQGYKLFARSAETGVLLSFAVPNSPNAPASAPKMFHVPFGHHIVAAGRVQRATVCVSMKKNAEKADFHIEAWGAHASALATGAFGSERQYSDAERVLEIEAPLGSVFPHKEGLAFLTGKGIFVALGASTQKVLAKYGWVKNMANEGGDLICAHYAGDYLQFASVNDPRRPFAPHLRNKSPQVFTGFGGHDRAPLWAISSSEGEWTLLQGSFSSTLSAPEDETVVGALATEDGKLGLVSQSADARQLKLWGRDLLLEVPRFASPIQHVAPCPFASLLAVYCENGELSVYSFTRGEFVLRFAGE